jgi:cellulose biosynthesis protein BcsQ
MCDERTNLGQQVAGEIRDFFKEKVFRTVIPRNVKLAEAPSHGMPVTTAIPNRAVPTHTTPSRRNSWNAVHRLSTR